MRLQELARLVIFVLLVLRAPAIATHQPDTAEAQFELGFRYYQLQRYIEASDVLEPAAEQGHAGARYTLGLMYYNGRGVSQDYEAAEKWFRVAAEMGHPSAQFHLGLMYKCGHSVLQDDSRARYWLGLAAEQAGDESGCVPPRAPRNPINFGNGAQDEVRDAGSNSKTRTRQAAEQGSGWDQYLLGLMHYNEQPPDCGEAVKWLRRASAQGYEDASFTLGVAYASGVGMPRDNTEAVKWYLLAAEQGTGGTNLRCFYDERLGVPLDDEGVAEWLRLAAQRGWADAAALVRSLESE